jgi:hypothetical protein
MSEGLRDLPVIDGAMLDGTANGVTTLGENGKSEATEETEEEESESAAEARFPSCKPGHMLPELTVILYAIRQARKRPLFALISDTLDNDVCDEVYSWRKELASVGKDGQLAVLIESPGGVLTDCYRIARLISSFIDNWEALVPNVAMSGATLICLGSSKIIMSRMSCLGPLDPQVLSRRPGRFFAVERQSPLEASEALRYLRTHSLSELDTVMQWLLQRSVTPQTALEAASKLAVELASPVLGKIDPYDLGAFQLDSKLSTEYCQRVAKPKNLKKQTQRNVNHRALVEKYPAHEFIIDAEEAAEIGLSVCEPDEELEDLFDELRPLLYDATRYIGMIPAEV